MTLNNHYRIASALTNLLENKFNILGFKFGLDPLLSFIPGLGSTIGAILAFYIVIISYRVGLDQKHINKMIGNIIADFVIGLVPGIGNIADFLYKASSKNLKILEKYGNFNAVDGEIVEKEN